MKDYQHLRELITQWAEHNGLPDPDEYATEMIKFAEELSADYEDEDDTN